MTKNYSNAEITVHWQPEKCIHSARCIRSLPTVFHVQKRPWITLEDGSTEDIIRTVDHCPSGALSYSHNQDKTAVQPASTAQPAAEIRLMANGPLLVKGECVLVDSNGNELTTSGTFALCRCGSSSNKPFCDGTHKRIEFQG